MEVEIESLSFSHLYLPVLETTLTSLRLEAADTSPRGDRGFQGCIIETPKEDMIQTNLTSNQVLNQSLRIKHTPQRKISTILRADSVDRIKDTVFTKVHDI